MLALNRNARPPAARAPPRLVVPLQQVQKDDAQRAFELLILLVAHVVELIGDVERIGFGDPAGTQQFGLLERPAVQVAVIARRFRPRAVPSIGAIIHRYFRPSDVRVQLPNISRLTINRITSLVPSRIWCTRRSRSTRSMG